MKLFLLLVFCHNLFAAKHSLKYFVTGSSGVPNLPEFVGVMVVDGICLGYCDSSNKTLEPRKNWVKNILESSPRQLQWYTHKCFEDQPNFFKNLIINLKQQFNQSKGVHIIQRIDGCAWDENTGEVTGVLQYAYNGESFLEFDLKTLTWIALKPGAEMTKQRWNADTTTNRHNENFLSQTCQQWLKTYLEYGNSFLQRAVLPSVSLLQKTPSSPVSCHATGFYPDRAMMFWRKDGEELPEGVEHREILHNNDGTFQISVALNVSLIIPEDWRRYECVFHFSDIKDNVVTKLEKTVIKTNFGKFRKEQRTETTTHIITAVIVLVILILILIAAAAFAVYKKKKETHSEPSPDNVPEQFERLNPEAMETKTDQHCPFFGII